MTYYPFPTYQEEVRYDWLYSCSSSGKCGYGWVEQAAVKKSTYFMAGPPHRHPHHRRPGKRQQRPVLLPD
ncbi:MAG: hypothetical protein KJ063_24100 [Anaerolineae bacterium]|nr:hypothetical protein [Anaerolineae bacterium]